MAGKNKKKEAEPEYILVRVPDKQGLKDYIKGAQGVNRTMAQFAAECGTLTPSSFSRIIHGNIAKPLSVEVIRSIADHADVNSGVTFDLLMRANGYVQKNRENEKPDQEAMYSERENANKEHLKFVDRVKNLIAEELFARGYMIGRPYGDAFRMYMPKSSLHLSFPSSFIFRIQGIEPLFWCYTIVTEQRQFLSYSVSFGLKRFAEFFLRDAWEPETLRDISESLVFCEKEKYDQFWEMLEGREVNNRVSLILVDLEKERVIEEVFIPRKDKMVQKSLFAKKRMETDMDD